ncbi:hypothetical protein [Deinococcus ficus]|uniref:Uncharacterized protein n=1 Tax=Deinococcus ficus TaxID=317577 RepID=A0A221T345_9DEIO|nr:hypothetical protein [Deinococcus ficus]ASN83280.1 hypothetical protein DFI_18960 [Deinococcus ficus]
MNTSHTSSILNDVQLGRKLNQQLTHPLRSLAHTNHVAREIVEAHPEVHCPEDFDVLDLSHLQCLPTGSVPLYVQMDEVRSKLVQFQNDLANEAHTEWLIDQYDADLERQAQADWTATVVRVKTLLS